MLSDPLLTLEWIYHSQGGKIRILVFVFEEAMGSGRPPPSLASERGVPF